MAKKVSVKDAWKVLRLDLREASRDWVDVHEKAVNALSLEAPDPERIAGLVRRIADDLNEQAGEGQKSPVIRAIRQKFLPNGYEKARRRVVKSFDAYLAAWKAEHGSA